MTLLFQETLLFLVPGLLFSGLIYLRLVATRTVLVAAKKSDHMEVLDQAGRSRGHENILGIQVAHRKEISKKITKGIHASHLLLSSVLLVLRNKTPIPVVAGAREGF